MAVLQGSYDQLNENLIKSEMDILTLQHKVGMDDLYYNTIISSQKKK